MTEAATVAVDEKLYNEVRKQSSRVSEARDDYNVKAERAKFAKKYLEAAQGTLETLIQRLTAPESDLPLFTNQTDAIDQANADPVAAKLVERLLARGHDVNVLIVHGYTEEERAQVATYLDILEANDAEVARVADGAETASLTAVEVPAFLIPQPLTLVEIADLISRLAACDLEYTDEEITAWEPTEIADARAYLAQAEAVKAEKGEALTVDDLPEVPIWLRREAVIDEHVANAVTEILAGNASPVPDNEPAQV